ncbi:MAG: hypothetical protein JWN24_1750 [Phycisphaerales bacterium]|nr:hypothetical protein [Phycisphaerales bacterium]
MIRRQWAAGLALVAAITCFAGTGRAQFRGRMFGPPQQPGAGGVVNLPYMFNDGNGGQYRIFGNGWLQQQGNMPLYSQGAMLTINGVQPNANNNQGRVDEKTGELLIENLQANGLTLTRRISFDKEGGYVRYIDVIKNTQNQEQVANLSIQTNLNYGVNAASFVADPKKKDQNIAWIAQTGAGQSVVEVYAGKGSKVFPTLNWPQGNNFVTAAMNVPVPAGKEIAWLHLHKCVATQDVGTQWVNGIKESALLKSIPPALRRLIVNFPSTQGWIGDIELLRGDLLDVVELRSGDQFRGTLKETAYTLQTFYGPVDLPVEKVVGIINAGQFRPRQLLVTSDGQIFGGKLKKETLDLQLSSGQVTQIPMSQMSRVGYRKRTGEPEEWVFEKPMVATRSGERMVIKMPTASLDVATRYGKLSLKPESVAAVSLQNEENGVHEIFLTDGSKFAGLLGAEAFDVTLDAGEQPVKFPASTVARLQLSGKVAEVDDFTPTLHLVNDDLLVGTLTGKLSLETAFDTIAVNATEIRSLAHAKETVQDVQVVLWDGTSLSGQLQDAELSCTLNSGVMMKLPVSLLEEYSQPQPQPSPSMIEKIKTILADLNADDWKQRDRASAALVSMGPVAAGVLKQMRPKQPPEAQKAIDIVLQKLEEQRKAQKPAGSASGNKAPGVGGGPAIPQAVEVFQQGLQLNDVLLPDDDRP